MNSKKAMEGGTFWIVVGLIVGLIALFLLISFVVDNTGTSKEGLDNCEAYGGECKVKCSGSEISNPLPECSPGLICCVETE